MDAYVPQLGALVRRLVVVGVHQLPPLEVEIHQRHGRRVRGPLKPPPALSHSLWSCKWNNPHGIVLR